jgi:hypothetical protein
MMIVSSLVAASIAATQPAPAPQPLAIPTPAAEKKMACCEKMAKDEGCECCKGMNHEDKAAAGGNQDGHAGHDH